jgi:hypothetical protein
MFSTNPADVSARLSLEGLRLEPAAKYSLLPYPILQRYLADTSPDP